MEYAIALLVIGAFVWVVVARRKKKRSSGSGGGGSLPKDPGQEHQN